MRQYLFQSVVDFVALVIVLVLISVVRVTTDIHLVGDEVATSVRANAALLPGLLVFSIVLTAVQRFARPVLVVFFGKWLIRSLGLFSVVLDIVMFWLAIFLAPVEIRLASGPWWTIPIVAVLFRITDFGLAIVVGLNRPQLDRKRAHDALWRQLERLPSMRRNWVSERLRLEEAFSTFLSYGVEIGVADTPVGDVRRWFSRFVYGHPNPMDELSTPAKIRVMLEQLGPTYIKFGQMASSQSQTLPADWVVELAKLQSDVPPVPYASAREVLVDDLGRPPEELYASFEQEALAAASTAQVHRATLLDGTQVAVKVQRPNIVASVKADLGLLQDVSKLVENVSSYARDLHLSGMLAEFSEGVIRELDYHNEAYHALRLADILAPIPEVRVPVVYPELSGSRVLTMEFVDGVKVDTSGALDRSGVDRQLLTQAFMRGLIKQIFIDGFFHGDPHPGNIVLDVTSGELIYLDFGLVGRLDQAKRLDLIDLLFSFQQMDARGLATLALRVSKKTRPVKVNQFREDMGEMLNQYVRYAARPKFDTMVSQLVALLQKYGLRLDSQFMLAVKAVVQSEAVVAAMGGKLDVVPFAVQEVKSLTLAEITRDKVLETVQLQVTQVGKEVLRRVPSLEDAAVSWLDQFTAGKLIIHVEAQELVEQIDGLGTAFTKLTAGVVITGMIVATAIVTVQIWQSPVADTPLPGLAIILFLALLVIGGRMVWGLLHPPPRPYID